MSKLLNLLSAASEPVAENSEHVEATLLGLGPEGWVYVGITIFFLIAIFGMKGHRQVLAALDAQIAETRKSLDEARAIRDEAETLLSSAKAQQAASAKDAEGIIEHARQEAEAIIGKAENDATELVARREKMARDRIAAAELAAVEGLRARTASIAAAAARGLIAERHTADADRKLADEVISSI